MKKFMLVATLASFMVFGFAYAQSSDANSSNQGVNQNKIDVSALRTQLSEQKAKLEEARTANKLAKCEAVATRLQTKEQNFNTEKSKHVNQFVQVKEKINELITKYEAAGYDVSRLKTDMVTFDAKLKTFSDDYAAYVAELTKTKTSACGNSEGEFKAQLTISKNALKVVRGDFADLKDFWVNTIKKDILAIKEQKSTESAENTEPTVVNETNTESN